MFIFMTTQRFIMLTSQNRETQLEHLLTLLNISGMVAS